MHYVARISGGAGSTVAADRAVQKYGPDRVTLLFANTNTEHPSLYESIRYLNEVHMKGVEFVHLRNDGKNIWDVFNRFGYIKKGGTGCKASLELKKKPLDAYVKSRWAPGEATSITGLDFTEEDRIERFDKVIHAKGYATWHPLTEAPFMNACAQVEQIMEWGYPEQVMYSKGYPHNNCGGGCVLAGISQWVGLYHDFPETFRYHRDEEAKFIAKTDYPILRDRRGGDTKGMPLSILEERILNDDLKGLTEFRSTCSCMTPEPEEDSE